MTQVKKTTVGNIRFDKNGPSEFNGNYKHYGTDSENQNVVFWLKKDEILKEGQDDVDIWYKFEGKDKSDKYGNIKLPSARLEEWKIESNDSSNAGSYKGKSKGNGYNEAQMARLAYETSIRDPKLTVQGLMTNYSNIAIAFLNANKTPKDAEKMCDWVLERSKKDAEDLFEYVKGLKDE